MKFVILFITMLVLVTAPAHGATWAREEVLTSGNVGMENSIDVDSSGRMHISYVKWNSLYDRDLYFVSNASGAWVSEPVDTSSWVFGTSLAIDAAGAAHISYYDSDDYELRYAQNVCGFWDTEQVATSTSAMHDLAIGPSGVVHICFTNWSATQLWHATNASGSWHTEPVDTYGNVGTGCRIAVDFMGNVHISYYDYGNGDLMHAQNSSGSWVTETVDSAGDVGYVSSIAMDSLGRPHISYHDWTNDRLKYAMRSGGVWTIEIADDKSGTGGSNSLAVDSSDHVHICYNDHQALKYATNLSGIWEREIADSTLFTGSHHSIDIGPGDLIHIGYQNSDKGDLLHACGWTHESLVSDVTEFNSWAGGTVNFTLDAQAAFGNRSYVLLAGVTGALPGTPLPGGTTFLPLNIDVLTDLVLRNLNSGLFSNFQGVLDPMGRAAAQLNSPVLPTGGFTLYFAFTLYNPFGFASNPVEIYVW